MQGGLTASPRGCPAFTTPGSQLEWSLTPLPTTTLRPPPALESLCALLPRGRDPLPHHSPSSLWHGLRPLGQLKARGFPPTTHTTLSPNDFGGAHRFQVCSRGPWLGTTLISRVLFERSSSVQANCFLLSTGREGRWGENEPQKSARLRQ